ncbi:DUF4262 domain-containing protein [Gordonia sp. (in: high G+C Gram-positive bacteria)]|uniref:DUF4262 domain-containing protein n=1 Tax=Gordonia sp. (in: high G+C Gram-positive bacteria) TaxID=84139 RepID=UPI003C74975C
MCEFDPRCDGSDDLVGGALALIAQGRWAVTGVFGSVGHPPLAYTTGLTELGLPELAITGLPPDLACVLLNHAAQASVDGTVVAPGSRVHAGMRKPVWFEAIDVIDLEPLRLSRLVFGQGFSTVQLVWPDHADRYPWQVGYSIPSNVQPLMGVPTARPSSGDAVA